jgi:hypothetical protein
MSALILQWRGLTDSAAEALAQGADPTSFATVIGPPGYSNYQLWLQAGNAGTLEDYLAYGENQLQPIADAAAASAASAAGDAAATAADRVQTGLDRSAAAAFAASAHGDAIATAADRVQTGLDRIATAADRVQTGLDRTATAADRAQTGADRDAAATSAASAASLLDSFDDRYLGVKAADPTLDNDGNPLIAGALYWSTTSDAMKVYRGGGIWDFTAATMLDLASALDPAKGARLVGFDGVTVADELSSSYVIGSRLRRTHARIILANSGTLTRLTGFAFGDSVATTKMRHVIPSLDRMMGAPNTTSPQVTGVEASTASSSELALGTNSGVVAATTDYAYWPTGEVWEFANGGSASFIVGGGNPNFTKLKIFYIKEPGAGSIDVRVNGVSVGTINAANATTALGVYTYTQALAQVPVQLVATGAVKVTKIHTANETISGVDYFVVGKGGAELTDWIASAQCRAIFQAFIADILPDLITYEMKEVDVPNLPTNIATLFGIFDAAPMADKLVIGDTPRATGNADQLLQNQYLKQAIVTRPRYTYFDMYRAAVSYADMVTLGENGDGIHPGEVLNGFGGDLILHELGFTALAYAMTPRAVNDRSTASQLAKGTRIGAAAGKELKFDTDSFGLDWTVDVQRTIKFTLNGVDLPWRITDPASAFPSWLPMNVTFDGASGTMTRRKYTSLGPSYVNYTDSGDTSSHAQVMMGALRLADHTHATLPSASSKNGQIRYTTDRGLEMSRGGAWEQIPQLRGTQTTIGAAGGGAALPATPTGYLKIDLNGTTVAVPYYAAT